MNMIRPWTLQVLHDTQYASQGGVPRALTKLNLLTEGCYHGISASFGVALDFTKLFDCLCPDVVMQTASLMGLSEQTVNMLFLPIKLSRGAWRLPQNAAVPIRRRERGLPQGLASSVLASEIALSLLIWKLVCVIKLESVCYVDDLNFVTSSAEALNMVLRIISEFAVDMKVHISKAKTCLWGSDRKALKKVAEEWDLQVQDSFTTLGVEWVTNTMATPSYEKERSRVQEACLRLARLQHLPTTLAIKAHVVNMGILSLIDYCPAPCPTMYSSLRTAIKKVFSCVHGAPEVVLNVMLEQSLDPEIRWEVALLKLLSDTYKLEGGRVLIESVRLTRKHSRLAAALRLIRKRDWNLSEGVLLTPMRLSFRLPWPSIKARVMQAIKLFYCHKLAARRPRVHEGIDILQPKQHRRLLASMTTYAAMVMLRIWSGSALTRAHKHTIDATNDPACACGFPYQTIDHLLYHCPAVGLPDTPIRAWGEKPPAFSVALLCPPTLDNSELHT